MRVVLGEARVSYYNRRLFPFERRDGIAGLIVTKKSNVLFDNIWM